MLHTSVIQTMGQVKLSANRAADPLEQLDGLSLAGIYFRYRGPHPHIVSISSDAVRVAVSGPRR